MEFYICTAQVHLDSVVVVVVVSDYMIYIDNIYFGRMKVNAHSISSSFIYIFAVSHPAKVITVYASRQV